MSDNLRSVFQKFLPAAAPPAGACLRCGRDIPVRYILAGGGYCSGICRAVHTFVRRDRSAPVPEEGS